MDLSLFEPHPEIREAISKICAAFDLPYWLRCDDEKRLPSEFLATMRSGGWLGINAPEQYGGSGLGLTAAATMLQTITEHGGGWTAAGPVADYIFAPRSLSVHGTEAQKQRLLVPLIAGEQRACFAVTESDAGLDTTRLRTRAVRRGDYYYVTGEKVWITGADIADRMMILVRTAPADATPRPLEGLTLLYAPIDWAYVDVRPIRKHGFNSLASNVVLINDLPVAVEDRIGEEGKGFHCVLDNINPERIVLSAMAVGMGRFAVRQAAQYAKQRIVFGRPIGQNQAIQHPLAQCWAELEAANLMTFKAAALYDRKAPCGAEANAAKFLAAEAGYKSCKQAVVTHGGNGYATEFHMERQLREILLMQLAPVGQPLILSYIAERVLGLPKSY